LILCCGTSRAAVNGRLFFAPINLLAAIGLPMEAIGVLMVFDNFHYADEKTRLFFGSLVEVMERVQGSTLMVLSRELPQFYNRSHVKVRGTVAEFRLEGLDIQSCRAILEEREMGTEALGEIFALTNGHPLALELIDSYDEIGKQQDVRQFLEEEVRREDTSFRSKQ